MRLKEGSGSRGYHIETEQDPQRTIQVLEDQLYEFNSRKIDKHDDGVALKERDVPTRAAITALEGVLETRPLIAAWERVLAAPEHSGPARRVHGDVHPGNLLETTGNLSAVMNFGCLGVGDPACDLQVAWNFFPAEVRRAFRIRMGVDEAAWERGRGWALSVVLIALPCYRNTNLVLADISRRTIKEVLSCSLV